MFPLQGTLTLLHALVLPAPDGHQHRDAQQYRETSESQGVPPWRLYIEAQAYGRRAARMRCIDRHGLEPVVTRRERRNMDGESSRGVPLGRQAKQPITQLGAG